MSATYIGFLSYFLKNLKSTLSDTDYRTYLKKNLGANIKNAEEKDLRTVAFSLYYSNFIGWGMCLSSYGTIELASTKTVKTLKETLIAVDKFRKDHDIPPIPMIYYIEPKDVIKHMYELHESQDALYKFMDAGKPAAAKTVKSVKAAKPVTKKASPTVRKPAAKSTSTATSTTAKKTCSNYTVKELQALAAKKNISGRSKMNKAELCKALKIPKD